MLETWVPSLGWEDPQENEMAMHSNILAWKFPWTEEPGGLIMECCCCNELTKSVLKDLEQYLT